MWWRVRTFPRVDMSKTRSIALRSERGSLREMCRGMFTERIVSAWKCRQALKDFETIRGYEGHGGIWIMYRQRLV